MSAATDTAALPPPPANRREAWERMLPGIRQGVPLGIGALLIAFSFGVLARQVMGPVAPVVFSAVVFAGSAQFASLAVLASGGGALTAILSGILLNLRFLPMGIALGPSIPGGRIKRALVGQAVVDASWALSNQGRGRFDPYVLLGATLPQYPGWVLGTLLGVLGADLIGDPLEFGLDALFPAFFLALLSVEIRHRGGAPAAIGGALIALALIPWAPPGIPILAACVAALIGLRAR